MQELEKELKQEIARALKNTEQKLIYRLKVAQKGNRGVIQPLSI